MPNDSHELVTAMRDACQRMNPLQAGVVVAVSGGPDSVALTLGLHEIGIRPLIIGHINHQLRGAESDADAEFVTQLANAMGIPVDVRICRTTDDVTGGNLEATARRQRYQCLLEVARQANVPFIATGHTADDQAETLLFRMLRGSGLRGLAGIPPRRRWRGATIIRPMLHVRRAMVLNYLAAKQKPFRTDSSNQSLRFTRNRIRQQLIPMLESEFSPHVVDRLTALADQAGQWDRALNLHVSRHLRRCEMARSAALVILDVQKLNDLSEYLMCEVGRHIWRREHWPQGEMSAPHWHRLAAVMRGETPAVDFPGGISARRLPRVVRIGPGA